MPLFPSLRALLPPEKPQPRTRATMWSCEALWPPLMQAGELTPIERPGAVVFSADEAPLHRKLGVYESRG